MLNLWLGKCPRTCSPAGPAAAQVAVMAAAATEEVAAAPCQAGAAVARAAAERAGD